VKIKVAYFAMSAEFDGDRKHRLRLDRAWDAINTRRMVVIGLNPSTADALSDDPTIRRCIGFAKREGCGALTMINLFSLRATNPEDCKRSRARGAGDDNDTAILNACREGDVVVAAWGSHGSWVWDRASVVTRMLSHARIPLYHFGLTQDGQPRHPLYLPATAPLTLWPDGFPFDSDSSMAGGGEEA
jgi:hypothetical protein